MSTALSTPAATASLSGIDAWLESLRGTYPDADIESFRAAQAHARSLAADVLSRDGEPLALHAAGTAEIVASLKLDPASVRAALLIGLPATKKFDGEDLARRFGADVAGLVTGVARMDEIRALPATGDAEERAAQAERLRKMLLAMVEDIRVVLIKLAERTQAMRYLVAAGPSVADVRERAAREVLDLFAPLANRLGVWQLKWELEDLSLRALEPTTYKAIAKMLDERRADRERYIESVVGLLRRELAEAGIRADVTGRPKHIYSIWKKMRRKEVGIDALYDIRAVRILVDDVRDCYAALGIVITCGRRSPASSTITSRSRKPTAIARCTPRSSAPRARRSKCKFARSTCTSTPNMASPPIGDTRRRDRKACDATRRSRTALHGCDRCSTGKTTLRGRRNGSPRSGRASLPTRSMC